MRAHEANVPSTLGELSADVQVAPGAVWADRAAGYRGAGTRGVAMSAPTSPSTWATKHGGRSGVHLAEHPLSMDEIAGGMPSAFRNAAYMDHRAFLEAEGATGMADDAKAKGIAWRRWIEKIIGKACEDEHLIAHTADGRPAPRGAPASDLLYEANSNRPPYVHRRREIDVIKTWSIEYATLGARHAARAERRRAALAELDKARRILVTLPVKTTAERRGPVPLTVA